MTNRFRFICFSIVFATILILGSTSFSQTLFYIAKNPVLIPGSPQLYRFEIWMRTSDLTGTLRMGSCIIYLNYNSVPFGNSIASGARVTVTKNATAFGASYAMNTINDNTSARFAFSWTYTGGAGNGVVVPSDLNGVLTFTVQIQIIGNATANSGIDFQNSLMDGEQYFDDETNPWPAQLGVSFIHSGALPIQLGSFTAQRMNSSSVRLDWRTISEINNYGFLVQRKRTGETNWFEIPNSFIAGHGTTNEPHDYSFTDIAAPSGALQYRLKQIDLDGTIHFTEPIQVSGTTSVSNEPPPTVYALHQNYPNPFNPSAIIAFDLPEPSHVSLIVYDVLGRKIVELENGMKEAGYHSTMWNASNVASGMYFARFTATDENGNVKLSKVGKLLLAK